MKAQVRALFRHVSLADSLDLTLGACLSLQHNVKSRFTVQWCLCLYGRHKYTKFASLRSGVGPEGFMIKTRLCLPNSQRKEKQIAVTHTLHKREVQKHPLYLHICKGGLF